MFSPLGFPEPQKKNLFARFNQILNRGVLDKPPPADFLSGIEWAARTLSLLSGRVTFFPVRAAKKPDVCSDDLPGKQVGALCHNLVRAGYRPKTN